jgi:hypothetical protein
LCEIPEDAPGVPVRMPVHLRDAVGAAICLTGRFDSLDESELAPCRRRYSPARVRQDPSLAQNKQTSSRLGFWPFLAVETTIARTINTSRESGAQIGNCWRRGGVGSSRLESPLFTESTVYGSTVGTTSWYDSRRSVAERRWRVTGKVRAVGTAL